MPNSTINELKKAAKGLVYVSETDEPLHTFTWKNGEGSLTPEKLLELSKTDPGTKVEEVSLDDVFSTQTDEGYKNLLKVIQEQLSDVMAFRVDEVIVRYYVVGRTKQGDWAGIWTKAVET